MKKRFLLIFSFFLLILSLSSFARIECIYDEDCPYSYGSGEYLCDPQTNLCLLVTAPPITPAPSSQEVAQLNNTIINLTSRLQSLQQNFYNTTATLQNLQIQVQTLSASSQSYSSQLQILSTDIQDLRSQLSTLSANIESLSAQQGLLTSLSQNVNTLSTGLASLQTNLNQAQTNLTALKEQVASIEKSRSLTRIIFLVLLSLAVFAGLVFYIFYTKKPKIKIPPELKKHIFQSLKAGQPYSAIRKDLLQADWSADLIDAAYKEVLAYSYKKYSQAQKPQKPSSPFTSQRIIMIIVVSVIVLLGLFLILQRSGLLFGKAIAILPFAEFKASVQQTLEEKFSQNQFFPLVYLSDLCLQVKEGSNSVSYRLIKTPTAYGIKEAPQPCDIDFSSYDFVAKFTSLQAFQNLAQDLSCENIKRTHQSKGVYVLPSRYVLPGFKPNPQENYAPFCKVLSQCLSPQEISLLGINCP